MNDGVIVKLLALLFLLFIFIESDVFQNSVLKKIDGTVVSDRPTTKGIFVQGIFLVVIFMILFYVGENGYL